MNSRTAVVISALAVIFAAGCAHAGIVGHWAVLHNESNNPVTLEFDGKMLTARIGCTLFNPEYTAVGHEIRYSGLEIITDNPCDIREMKDQRMWRYWHRVEQIVETAETYEIRGDRLRLTSPTGGHLDFIRAKKL